jgi:hypothetical protein
MIRIRRAPDGWWAIVLAGSRAAMGSTLRAAVDRFRFARRELWICETWGRRDIGTNVPISR